MKKLDSIRYLNNPVASLYDKDHFRCCIIACTMRLSVLNGSKLQHREKMDSEIYYLKNTFHEYFREFQVDQFNYDFSQYKEWADQQYPLIDYFLKKLDNPYAVEERHFQEVESKVVRKKVDKEDLQMTISTNFTLLKFIRENGEEFIIKKKFPLKTKVNFIKKYLRQVLKLSGEITLTNLDNGQALSGDLKELGSYIDA